MANRVTIYIRKLRYQEAKNRLLHELDKAFANGYLEAEIIHGIGTYTLRKMVEEEIAKLDYVRPCSHQPNPGAYHVQFLQIPDDLRKEYLG